MKTRTAIILLALVLALSFAARAQIVSNGNGSGGGPPTGAAGGVLGGTYPNPDFNSTNTAGNTMNNQLTINNAAGHGTVPSGGDSNDLEFMPDTTNGLNAIVFDTPNESTTGAVGLIESGPVGNGASFLLEPIDNVSGPYLACASDETGTAEAGSCIVNVDSYFAFNNATNLTGNGPPNFLYGLTADAGAVKGSILPTSGAVSALPPCDSGENLGVIQSVVDAASCADGVQPTGGGGTHCPVFCDGVKWRALYTVAASTPLPSPTPTPTPLPTQTPTPKPT